MSDGDNLDRLLDSALSTYAEPSSGLEQRVLNALAAERLAEPAKSKQTAFPIRRWVPWTIGLAAAASLLLVLSVHYIGRHPGTQARNTVQTQPQRTIAPPGNITSEPTHLAVVRTPKARAPHLAPVSQTALPKLDVFPAPQPLTAEERTLAVIARETPVPLRKALVEAQSLPDAPLHIAEISIPPIEPHDQVQP